MLVAVLSDIHSNVFALRPVLQDAKAAGADEVWMLGDTFGYYPWADDTFGSLGHGRLITVAVLGNHDHWLLHPDRAPKNVAGDIASRNAADLECHGGLALDWLTSLAPLVRLERRGWKFTLAHGTPDDALDGRYYPDDRHPYSWLPNPGEILILGQTHYPLMRGEGRTGLLLNPGSVGQPRDGNPMPSWALLDLTTGTAELRRTQYDNRGVMTLLRELEWDEGLVSALDRRST